jgi:outer membrane protein OmpA-like peptidoglycan-associated protein
LQLVADTIKESPDGTNFTIVGHADADTGTAEFNQALSERRAETVYKYLIEHGVNKNCLTWKGVGATDSIFPVNNTNRVVIVK